MREINFYAVLGVDRSASAEAIRRAYEAKLVECQGDPTLELKEVEWAFRALNDPARRKKFDLWLDLKRDGGAARPAASVARPSAAVPKPVAEPRGRPTQSAPANATGEPAKPPRAERPAARAGAGGDDISESIRAIIMSGVAPAPAPAAEPARRAARRPPSSDAATDAGPAPTATKEPGPGGEAPRVAPVLKISTFGREAVDYYRILRVERAASMAEIEEAYQRLKKDVRAGSTVDASVLDRAFEELSNPRRRLKYNKRLDRERAQRRRDELLGSGLLRRTAIVVAVLSLASIVIYVLSGSSGLLSKDLSLHDELYRKDTGELLGTIVDVATRHEFEGGNAEPGYLVRLAKDESDKWFPQQWIRYFCRRTKPPARKPVEVPTPPVMEDVPADRPGEGGLPLVAPLPEDEPSVDEGSAVTAPQPDVPIAPLIPESYGGGEGSSSDTGADLE